MSSSVIPATTPVSWTAVPDGSAASPSFAFSNSSGTGFYRVSANVLGVSTAGVQRMVVDASGNVGVGVSPSAWGNTFKTVEFSGGASSTGDSTGNIYISANTYYDGTNWKYKNTASAGNYYVSGNTHVWRYAASGTAGNNITWSEAMRIDASGNLLVGKTTASDPAGAGVYVSSAGGIYSTQTGSINYLTCYNTTASAYRFYVSAAGQINATSTSITAISDESLKENIRDLETGLSQVLALKPRRFDWKEETQIKEKSVAGFIAQEVEEVLPELVYEYKYNETATKKSLKMGDMLPTLVKAIQEQQEIIGKLEARLAALESKP